MTKKTIHVRKVEEELWRKFRSKAVERGLDMGEALEQAVTDWIKKR